MALVKCRECQRPISTDTHKCPMCGALTGKNTPAANGCLLFLFIFIGLPILIWIVAAINTK
jgi:hypothetical protein